MLLVLSTIFECPSEKAKKIVFIEATVQDAKRQYYILEGKVENSKLDIIIVLASGNVLCDIAVGPAHQAYHALMTRLEQRLTQWLEFHPY